MGEGDVVGWSDVVGRVEYSWMGLVWMISGKQFSIVNES